MPSHDAAQPRATQRGSAGDRKVVLARHLAVAEAERLGIRPSKEDVLQVTLWWQGQFGLQDPTRFSAWLEYAGLSMERFSRMMFRFAALSKVLDHYEREVDEAMGDHLAIHSVHAFGRATEDRDRV